MLASSITNLIFVIVILEKVISRSSIPSTSLVRGEGTPVGWISVFSDKCIAQLEPRPAESLYPKVKVASGGIDVQTSKKLKA
jgi:hypothetical protein